MRAAGSETQDRAVGGVRWATVEAWTANKSAYFSSPRATHFGFEVCFTLHLFPLEQDAGITCFSLTEPRARKQVGSQVYGGELEY